MLLRCVFSCLLSSYCSQRAVFVFVVYVKFIQDFFFFLILPQGPSILRNQKVVNYGEFGRDHISQEAIFIQGN